MMRPLVPGRRALVTGGAGFIGSHLVRRLVEAGLRVTVVDDLSTGNRASLDGLPGEVDLITSGVEQALQGRSVRPHEFDYVFHLAANPYIPTSVEDPALDYRSNLASTFALLESLRGGPRGTLFLLASSAAVYGNPARLPIQEQDPTVPISPYGVSKLAAERYAAVYAAIYGVPAVSLRLFSVYGPRQRKQVVYDFMRKLQEDPGRLEVIGNGSQERDLTFVTDVAEAFVVAATRAPGAGEALNVATGRSVTIAQLAEGVARVWGASPEIRYTGRSRPGDADRWRVDVSGLAALGFAPRVDLDSGLAAVRDWMRSE